LKEIINQTENRAVLHTALRAKESAVVYVNGKNIVPDVYDVKERYNPFEIIAGGRTGYTGKPLLIL
jgi:glucose-6-phosphate isomerase